MHMGVEGKEEDLVEEVGKKISDIYIYCTTLLPWILLLQLIFFFFLVTVMTVYVYFHILKMLS